MNPANVENELNFGTLEGSSLLVLSRILSEVRSRGQRLTAQRAPACAPAANARQQQQLLTHSVL
jgi:hypothetical protein